MIGNTCYKPPKGKLRILFEDRDFIAVDKPHGLLTVPGRLPEHKDSLLTRLQGKFQNILVVHRLDMDTSGIVLFAKNKASQSYASAQFSDRRVKKIYFARVFGKITKVSGIINFPLTSDWANRPLQKVCRIHGKVCETRWRLLRVWENSAGQSFSELVVQPITGRTHQIRLHLKEMGYPILGDRFYGNADCHDKNDRLNLYAVSLSFYHKSFGRRLRISTDFNLAC